MPHQNDTHNRTVQSVILELAPLIDEAEKIEKVPGAVHNHNHAMTQAESLIQLLSVPQWEQSITISTLIIRNSIVQCWFYGRKEQWQLVIQIASKAMDVINKIIDNVDARYISYLEASLLAYKGFCLLKTNKMDEAIIALSKSYDIRMTTRKDVALVVQQTSKELAHHDCLHDHKETIKVEKTLIECCLMKGIDTPLPPLTKFSRTSHLFNTGGTAVSMDDIVVSKDDEKVFSQMANGVNGIYVEEKVDGANMGFTLCADGEILAQNRSHYISSGDHAQFSQLTAWVEEHRQALIHILNSHGETRVASQGLILYGEWLVAKHSISYHKLPSHFVAFDIYDRKHRRFLSRERFHTIMKKSGIPVVPLINVQKFGPYHDNFLKMNLNNNKIINNKSNASKSQSLRYDLRTFLETKSKFRNDNGYVEGVILRVDNGEWLEQRFKIVRPDFVAGCGEGHWSSRDIEKQVIDYDFAQEYLNGCYICAKN
mmetsp:Transcript_65/g.63  ORF Transcript_65/g.63 Transcript_65/m.63 type:complete len:484 (-) Transcript_65:251-1702(-)